MSKPTLKT